MPIFQCKYCFEEEENYDNFISPCDCNGSQQFVHKDCLNRWLNSDRNNRYVRCSECHGIFQRKFSGDIDYKLNNDAFTIVSFYESIGFCFMFLFLFLSQYILDSIVYLILLLYIITIIYLTPYCNYTLYIAFLFLVILGSLPLKIKRIVVFIWIILLFCLYTTYIYDNLYIDVLNYLKKQLPSDLRADMFDNYLHKYVSGII